MNLFTPGRCSAACRFRWEGVPIEVAMHRFLVVLKPSGFDIDIRFGNCVVPRGWIKVMHWKRNQPTLGVLDFTDCTCSTCYPPHFFFYCKSNLLISKKKVDGQPAWVYKLLISSKSLPWLWYIPIPITELDRQPSWKFQTPSAQTLGRLRIHCFPGLDNPAKWALSGHPNWNFSMPSLKNSRSSQPTQTATESPFSSPKCGCKNPYWKITEPSNSNCDYWWKIYPAKRLRG